MACVGEAEQAEADERELRQGEIRNRLVADDPGAHRNRASIADLAHGRESGGNTAMGTARPSAGASGTGPAAPAALCGNLALRKLNRNNQMEHDVAIVMRVPHGRFGHFALQQRTLPLICLGRFE